MKALFKLAVALSLASVSPSAFAANIMTVNCPGTWGIVVDKPWEVKDGVDEVKVEYTKAEVIDENGRKRLRCLGARGKDTFSIEAPFPKKGWSVGHFKTYEYASECQAASSSSFKCVFPERKTPPKASFPFKPESAVPLNGGEPMM